MTRVLAKVVLVWGNRLPARELGNERINSFSTRVDLHDNIVAPAIYLMPFFNTKDGTKR